MNRKTYRAAFDQVKFREDFQRETVDLLLTQAGQRQEKENVTMNIKQIKRLPLIAAVVAALIVSAAAATLFLHPADVARHAGDPVLAAAFESTDATLIDQSIDSGDYRFTFAGMVSGAGLSGLTTDVDTQHTYVVVTAQRLDGQPIDGDVLFDFTATPMVSGYMPWSVNAWTLSGGFTSFTQDGITYYLYEYDSLEMFAGRTVYLAVYEGMVPSAELFDIADDGTISFKKDVEVPHALFTLPLDPAKADPAAVAEFEKTMREEGFILTPAEQEAALAQDGGEEPGAAVEPFVSVEPVEGDGILLITP